MKEILIDGYNMIKSPAAGIPGHLDLALQREHLLKRLNSAQNLRNYKITVVFDGKQNQFTLKFQNFKNIKVIFSSENQEADDIIQQLIRKKSMSDSIEIISSDQKIQRIAKDHMIQFRSSGQFWRQLSTRKPKNSPNAGNSTDSESLSDKEVQEWLKLFSKRDDAGNEY